MCDYTCVHACLCVYASVDEGYMCQYVQYISIAYKCLLIHFSIGVCVCVCSDVLGDIRCLL